jgi:hypothetical protein
MLSVKDEIVPAARGSLNGSQEHLFKMVQEENPMKRKSLERLFLCLLVVGVLAFTAFNRALPAAAAPAPPEPSPIAPPPSADSDLAFTTVIQEIPSTENWP